MAFNPQDVGRVGQLSLTFTSKRGKTIVGDCFCEIPFKITQLYDPGNDAPPQLIIMNPTAGLFGGDRASLNVIVEQGTQVCLTTQSAQKIHPAGDKPAQQITKIHVQSGGTLHYYVDPLIPFAESILHQETTITLEEGAQLFYWDGLSAGRVRHGEQWKFIEIRSSVQIYHNERLIYLDRFKLAPHQHSPQSVFTMGDCTQLATSVAFASSITTPLIKSMQEDLLMEQEEIVGALDHPHPALMVGRFVSQSGAALSSLQHQFYRAAFEKILDQPFVELRK